MATIKKRAVTDRRRQQERRNSFVDRRGMDGLRSFRQQGIEEFAAGVLRICDKTKKVFVGGNEKHLTPIEYELLCLLATNVGRVISSKDLSLDLWPRKQPPDLDALKQYIYRLRKKIETDPHAPRWIRSVAGFGYQLVVDDDDNATQ